MPGHLVINNFCRPSSREFYPKSKAREKDLQRAFGGLTYPKKACASV